MLAVTGAYVLPLIGGSMMVSCIALYIFSKESVTEEHHMKSLSHRDHRAEGFSAMSHTFGVCPRFRALR